MTRKLGWKTRVWIASFAVGLIFFYPLTYLLPYGSMDPRDIGFWNAFYIAFITGIPITYYIIRQQEKSRAENNKAGKSKRTE